MVNKKKFIPILGDDLEKMTDEQRRDYIIAACEYVDLPPELNLVDLIYLDSGFKRALTLYIKKGGADIIRSKRGINVLSLVSANGDGYVAFVATGKDSTGRQEIAVGASSIKGLTSGQQIADAVMTSQTKACRRLTLQFVGGGFSDESEVKEGILQIPEKPNAVQPIQPQIAPNASAGKDITDASKANPASSPTPVTTSQAESAVSLTAVSAAEEPKRRKRIRKISTLDSPSESEKLQAELEPLPESKFIPSTESAASIIKEIIQNSQQESVIPKLDTITLSKSITTEEKPFVGTRCTAEQLAAFRRRLSTLVNETLPPAGFLQSEKLGSRNEKIKLFVQKMFPSADTKNLSVEQWEYFFNFMTRQLQTIGATELVKFIDEKIGEKHEAAVGS